MLRDIGAIIAGLAVSIAVIMAVQMVGHTLWPAPDGLDWNDTEVIRTYTSQLPFLALLFPIVSYFLGALAGPYVACRIGIAKPLLLVGVAETLARGNQARAKRPLDSEQILERIFDMVTVLLFLALAHRIEEGPAGLILQDPFLSEATILNLGQNLLHFFSGRIINNTWSPGIITVLSGVTD